MVSHRLSDLDAVLGVPRNPLLYPLGAVVPRGRPMWIGLFVDEPNSVLVSWRP